MVGTMEIGTRIGDPARRQHDRSFKAGLVEQSLQPGASVAVIARNNGINANLLFKWRRDHKGKTIAASMPTAAPPTVLLPVHVEPVAKVGAGSALEPLPIAAVGPGSRATTRGGVIELEFAGAQLRLRGAVDEAALCSVLRALRHSA
jgi:transposase